MATELVHWCDWHISDEHSSRVIGTAHHVVVIDGAEYTLDLCEECDVKRLEPLLGFVSLVGVRTNVQTRKRREHADRDDSEGAPPRKRYDRKEQHPDDDGVTVTCPICQRVTGARPGLAAHGVRAHGTGSLFSLFVEAARLRGDGPEPEREPEAVLIPAPTLVAVDA